MNYQHFLDERLKFAVFLYDSTVPQFVETKRKIEAHEPPYEDRRHPEDETDEPPYLAEWEQADLAADVIGMTALGQVKIALHTFLRDFTSGSFGKKMLDSVPRMQQKSWLGNFRALYATDPYLDWKNSGADLELLEQLVLTRNDFEHNADLHSPYTFQDLKHKEKYPDSAFQHPTWMAVLRQPRLHVTRERLIEATVAVSTLAKFLHEANQIRRNKAWRARRATS